MYRRYLTEKLDDALSDTPVVLLIGPRRAGKTTLAREREEAGRPYVTLDDAATLNSARTDPTGFIRRTKSAIIDEVQRVPSLLLAIKKEVDEDFRPGKYILTGSANVMALPTVADSLAGRMETLTLLPLAQGEILSAATSFLDRVFAGKNPNIGELKLGDELAARVLTGGFPELVAKKSAHRRAQWCESYLTSVLSRDLRDIATIEHLAEVPKLVHLLAEHSGQLVNFTSLGTPLGLSIKTCQRYLTMLERIFLVSCLQPWFTNRTSRLVKTPKVHFMDPALLASRKGIDLEHVAQDPQQYGPILETFVYSELLKLSASHPKPITPYHYRDNQQREVDILLERSDGALVGIEVKASATVGRGDFKGLRAVEELAPKKFRLGVVLYDGESIVPFGERMIAAPLSSLWG